MDPGIRAIWPVPRTIGAAVTVWCHAGDNIMYHKALSCPNQATSWSSTPRDRATPDGANYSPPPPMKVGLRGVILDGMVRDIEALESLRMPVWARGLSVSGCNKDGAGEVGAISPAVA